MNTLAHAAAWYIGLLGSLEVLGRLCRRFDVDIDAEQLLPNRRVCWGSIRNTHQIAIRIGDYQKIIQADDRYFMLKLPSWVFIETPCDNWRRGTELRLHQRALVWCSYWRPHWFVTKIEVSK